MMKFKVERLGFEEATIEADSFEVNKVGVTFYIYNQTETDTPYTYYNPIAVAFYTNVASVSRVV